MSKFECLSDIQWSLLEPILPETPKREDGKGRPELYDNRCVMNGILWVLRTGACWSDIPDRFPSGSTCYRRFSRWVRSGVMRTILETLARDLEKRGGIDLSECYIDGTFMVAKKGAKRSEKPKKGKEPSLWSYRMLEVYRSGCTRHLLSLMRSPLSKLQLIKLTPWEELDELLEIVPMTLIRWMKNYYRRG